MRPDASFSHSSRQTSVFIPNFYNLLPPKINHIHTLYALSYCCSTNNLYSLPVRFVADAAVYHTNEPNGQGEKIEMSGLPH